MRLIDADKLKGQFSETGAYTCKGVREIIDNTPTVEERPKGRWIETGYETGALGITYQQTQCSNCGWEYALPTWLYFCPNCGADMRGDL